MKSIKELLVKEDNQDINDEYGVEIDVPKGAEIVSIMIDSPKGWEEECIFYKYEPLMTVFDGAKAEEVKKALSKVGGTYLNVQGKSKTLLIRFK